MIFVITGTERFQFNRLVTEIDKLVDKHVIKDEVFIQLGACTYKPINCFWKKYLYFSDMCDNINQADVVVAHAGAGTTLLCIELGKKPILFPRRKFYGEHVDDHQLSFAKKIETTGKVEVVYDESCLQKKIENAYHNKQYYNSRKHELENYLLSYWEKIS